MVKLISDEIANAPTDELNETDASIPELFVLPMFVVGKDGVTLGMTTFGKSAPYKDIYQLFNLTSDEIVKIVKAKLNK